MDLFENLSPEAKIMILGGQKSGKSSKAQALAQSWLGQHADHQSVLLATAQAHDAQMHKRIARHQEDRRNQVPRMQTVEVPFFLANAVRQYSNPQTLLVIDCLTMWLTNWLMPLSIKTDANGHDWQEQADAFLKALSASSGPVVMVSNEIGLGVIPLGEDVRDFVDSLGLLNQQVAARSDNVLFMAAGLALQLR